MSDDLRLSLTKKAFQEKLQERSLFDAVLYFILGGVFRGARFGREPAYNLRVRYLFRG